MTLFSGSKTSLCQADLGKKYHAVSPCNQLKEADLKREMKSKQHRCNGLFQEKNKGRNWSCSFYWK